MAETKKLKTSDFVHLHNHTQYSLLDGLTKIPPLVQAVKSMGMEAIAITDHGTLSGVIEFYKNAKENDVKPIVGIETYVAPRKLSDRDPTKDKTPFHLIVLAMNNEGYQNLMQLSSIANLDGFYYRPRVDHDLLKKYSKGLIVLSGCIGGEVGDALRQGQYKQAKEVANWYKSVFGDRYYLEIQDHGHSDHPSAWDEQVEVTKQTLKLAKELGVECVLTSDAHYLKHSDQEAHEILLCVQTGSFLSDDKRMSLKEFDLHVSDPQEIIKRWGKEHPKLITNTKKIAQRCNVNIELGKILIPKFPVPKGQTDRLYLENLVFSGLAWRYGNKTRQESRKLSISAAKKIIPANVLERANYELGIIEQMGFSSYFLIVADFVNWGKNEGIVFGPGRGSTAGSIVAYSLSITELDPLHYDLLFERFLNPDRVSMPDADIDIQDSRREEVIQYCVEKYGADRVANIVTFGRMAARNAVRDVARVLQVPYADADRLAKMIPPPIQGRHTPLEKSLKENSELRQEYHSNEQSKQVFDLAIQLEGTIRSHGVHAAGVVIAPDAIVKYAPLEMAQKGVVATQYSMGPIEELGLLKMDFLGLSNLTIIKNALRIIKKVYGKEIDIDQVELTDKKTFELLSRGDTTGVFQLESAGMKRYLKELKPTVFDDIIAMGALYRPGPMQWIEDFIARKHGQRKVEYLHPTMEAALKPTYGIIVYQEQVMQISRDLSGFSGGQSDTLRKAIGKKKPEEMAKMKSVFIEGAIKTVKADRRLMEKFWKQLEAFAAYAFPKSHAACYALISYRTAYLKAHYPEAYMAALMTSDYDNIDRLAVEIDECKRMGIEVLAPDVNQSFVEFAVVPGAKQIRFGMAAIKNVGTGAVEEILRARQEGNFNNLEDFMSRVSVRLVNRKALESLIKAGALDAFDDRSKLLNNLDVILAFASRMQKQKAEGQTDLFGDSFEADSFSPKLILSDSGQPLGPNEQLQWERDLLGIYLSSHPLEAYTLWLEEQTVPLSSITEQYDNKKVQIGGVIADVRSITTKNGQKMAFVKISDNSGEKEIVIFPKIYQSTAKIWQRDQVISAKGTVSSKDRTGRDLGEAKILINEAAIVTPEMATNYRSTGKKISKPRPSIKKTVSVEAEIPIIKTSTTIPPRVYIRLSDSSDQTMLVQLKETIDEYQGETEVVLVLGKEENKQAIKLPMRMQDHGEAMAKLENLVGAANVKIK